MRIILEPSRSGGCWNFACVSAILMGNDQILLDSLFMFTDSLKDNIHTVKDQGHRGNRASLTKIGRAHV